MQPLTEPGRIVVLNGAPRSGKSSIAAAIRESFAGPWMNLGVDVFVRHVIPARHRPGIGLRPGGERPDLEPLLPALYAALYESIMDAGLPDVAQYAVSMAYRIRFVMDMNAREAMHVIELRTAPQGHPAYRRVCQAMHRQIEEVAGHRAIAAAMRFADHSAVELERLQEERRLEQRRGRMVP